MQTCNKVLRHEGPGPALSGASSRCGFRSGLTTIPEASELGARVAHRTSHSLREAFALDCAYFASKAFPELSPGIWLLHPRQAMQLCHGHGVIQQPDALQFGKLGTFLGG